MEYVHMYQMCTVHSFWNRMLIYIYIYIFVFSATYIYIYVHIHIHGIYDMPPIPTQHPEDWCDL